MDNALKEVKITNLKKDIYKTRDYQFMITKYFSDKVLKEIDKILRDKKF